MEGEPDDNNVEFVADEDAATLVNVDVAQLLPHVKAPMPGSSTAVVPSGTPPGTPHGTPLDMPPTPKARVWPGDAPLGNFTPVRQVSPEAGPSTGGTRRFVTHINEE